MISMLGCGDDGAPARDAGSPPADAASPTDAGSALSDATVPLAWVDFAVSGCDPVAPDPAPGLEIDAGAPAAPACQGTAPLTLRFSALAPATVDVYVWRFGDSDSEPLPDSPTPTHVYELPGTYDVTLTVRGPGGSAAVERIGAVVVRAAVLGARCTQDAQCGTERDCLCDADSTCPAALSAGLCTATCGSGVPCAEGVCADLAPTAPADPTDWQRQVCLSPCGTDRVCPAGEQCQELLAGDGSGWTEACLAPGVLADLGGSCKSADGRLDHDRCASGVCLDLGARGACAAPCGSGDCPPGAACADIVGLGSFCLARCADVELDCQDDPWLACEAPGAAAGFTVDEPAAPAGYCARRTCTAPDDCGPDGACDSGLCGPR
ncbi:PKD domain-containing protein [Haliangium sp.]|uniref:PKD domain-containing protein n=1 Tax=Haliangium sp. TaxID=2663208 RepID=UPI003D0B287B